MMEIRLRRRGKLGVVVRLPSLFFHQYGILRRHCGVWESMGFAYRLCRVLL